MLIFESYICMCILYTTDLSGILRSHLSQYGAQQLLSLFQNLGILTEKVARNGQFHISLEQEGNNGEGVLLPLMCTCVHVHVHVCRFVSLMSLFYSPAESMHTTHVQ